MHVTIIGTGDVGRALAAGLTAADHEVVVGSRTPDSTTVGDAEVREHRAAAEGSDVVVLSVPATVVVDLAGELADVLADTPVVDPTNEHPTPRSERSIADRVATAAPDAHVVKAFNTIGANRMTDPMIDGLPATMFLAGDDDAAVDVARRLAADLGFDPLVAGDLDAAGHLEHLARFWIHLSREYGRDVGFRLQRETSKRA